MALPSTPPAGVDPYAYLNFLAQIERANNSQQNQLARRQTQQQSVAGNQQFQMLMQMLQGQSNGYNEAKAANQQRANDIYDRDLATRNRLLDYVGQYGQSTLDDVNRENQRLRGADTAALSAAGFLGASPDRMRGADIVDTRAYLGNLNKAKDSLLQNAISTDERATNRLSDFQERISDPYPDNSGAAALAGQLGSVIPAAGGGLGSGVYGNGNSIYSLYGTKSPLADVGGQVQGHPLSQGSIAAGNQWASNPTMGWNDGRTFTRPGATTGPAVGPYGVAPNNIAARRLDGANGFVGSTATPTPYLSRPAAPVSNVRPLSGDQRDSLSQAQNQTQMPWNAGNPTGWSPGTQNPAMTSVNGQTVPLNKPMPALGIFGAGVQMANTGGGGGYYGGGSPYGYPGGQQVDPRLAPGTNPYYQQRFMHPSDRAAFSSVGTVDPYSIRPYGGGVSGVAAADRVGPPTTWDDGTAMTSPPANAVVPGQSPSLGKFDMRSLLSYLGLSI